MGWGIVSRLRVATKHAARILGPYGDGVGVFEGLHIFPWHQVVQSNGHPGSPLPTHMALLQPAKTAATALQRRLSPF